MPGVDSASCSLKSIGIDHIIVFGNSTDYTFAPDEGLEQAAWPERLGRIEPTTLLQGVEVVNQARRGQTIGALDVWGDDPSFNMVEHAPLVVRELDPAVAIRTLAIIAPSYIDLQVNGFDVESVLDDLALVVGIVASSGIRTMVLPMNYVSESLTERLPELNPSIEEFNRRLRADQSIHLAMDDSPLRTAAAAVGDNRFFDDYPGRDLEGDFVGADGFHPDDDGQEVKALAVHAALRRLVEFETPRTTAAVDSPGDWRAVNIWQTIIPAALVVDEQGDMTLHVTTGFLNRP